ncbi:hypothetical protein HW555_011846 [Spodoptera exigua]|uniref:Sugar transporter SWEET1 n=1 Tax=Spodoptera exigua TaxID=7107 RepID=A0A835G4M7_SPOEX|nr:hypothetical protein HW555_011846 [Spodoptera exigua]
MLDVLADVLQPYKEIVGNIAAIVTVGQMFSGSFICWDIYKQGNTKGIGIMPFLGGVIMSVLNLKFGYILRDDKMIQVNLFGLALNIIYCMIYFNYTQEKMKVWAQIGLAGAFSAGLIAYAQMEDPKLVENRFGTIITAFMFYLIASPLFGLVSLLILFTSLLCKKIIKNRCNIQNLVAVVLCGSQLALFVIYPSKPKPSKEKKPKAKKAD